MSHFSVAVFTKPGGKTLAELMNIYNANFRVPKYLLFTKEQIIEMKKQKLKEGMPYYSMFLVDPDRLKKICPDNELIQYFQEEFPKQLKWSDEEIYANEIRGWPLDLIGPNGEIYSTRNPNAKWKNYEIGGQYSNLIVLKNGTCTYSALVKDIDFEPNGIMAIKARLWWEINIEGRKPKLEESFLVEKKLEPSKEFFINLYKDKESFAKIVPSFRTYAVITPNGMWYEKGSTNTLGSYNDEIYLWELEYNNLFIKQADPEWTLTVVDCII